MGARGGGRWRAGSSNRIEKKPKLHSRVQRDLRSHNLGPAWAMGRGGTRGSVARPCRAAAKFAREKFRPAKKVKLERKPAKVKLERKPPPSFYRGQRVEVWWAREKGAAMPIHMAGCAVLLSLSSRTRLQHDPHVHIC